MVLYYFYTSYLLITSNIFYDVLVVHISIGTLQISVTVSPKLIMAQAIFRIIILFNLADCK